MNRELEAAEIASPILLGESPNRGTRSPEQRKDARALQHHS